MPEDKKPFVDATAGDEQFSKNGQALCKEILQIIQGRCRGPWEGTYIAGLVATACMHAIEDPMLQKHAHDGLVKLCGQAMASSPFQPPAGQQSPPRGQDQN